MSKMFAEGQPCHKGVGHEGGAVAAVAVCVGEAARPGGGIGFRPEPRTPNSTRNSQGRRAGLDFGSRAQERDSVGNPGVCCILSAGKKDHEVIPNMP